MHIRNLTINIHGGPPSFGQALMAAMVARPTSDDEPVGAALVGLPAIGEVWPGQGGIYAGLARGEDGAPDQHLILAIETPTSGMAWADAMSWAKTVEADGHKDFHVPTRFESALLYANLQDQLDTKHWHWTSSQYSGSGAWGQHFDYGSQDSYGKSAEGRVRAVRRLNA